MQGVGFQRLARCLGGDAVEHACAEEIDHDGDSNHAKRPGRRVDGMTVTAE